MAQELIRVEQLQYALQQVKGKTDTAIADAEGRCVAKVEGKDLVLTTDIAQITTNKTDIETMKGGEAVEGSIAKAVKDGINAFANEVSDDATVNTFKELVDYAATHNSEYTTLAGEVQGNTTALGTLNADAETAGSVDYKIAQAITDVNGDLEDYVKKEDISYATNDNIDTMINAIFAKPLTD